MAFPIDPELLEWDQNMAGINPGFNKHSVGEKRADQDAEEQETQSLVPVHQPDSHPLAAYRVDLTGRLSNNLQLCGNATPNDKDPETNPLVDSPRGLLLEGSTIEGFRQMAWKTPQAKSPAIKKGRGPFTLEHPMIQEYLALLDGNEHLHKVLKCILQSRWYKKGGQEQPPVGELLASIHERPSSSTPISLFGEFFSVKHPYTCFLCPKGSRPCKRSLERALGHSRSHFDFKPIHAKKKGYTNVNTKNDQLRRARNPKRNCQVCGATISMQNFSRHRKTH